MCFFSDHIRLMYEIRTLLQVLRCYCN